MEGPASQRNSMLYLWQQPMQFNPTDSCKYRIVTSVKISQKTLPKLQTLLHLKFSSLTSRKVLTNLQVYSIIMVFSEQQILKRSLNLHQSKTSPRGPQMSQMNKLNNQASKKTTMILQSSRSPREVMA